MSLNISKGNMYEFVTHTWNTVKGKCGHDCSYCYMKRFDNLKDIRFDEKELKTNLGENNFIFVGSSNDLFSSNIPNLWIDKTLDHCNRFLNNYLFQSKNTNRIFDYLASIDNEKDVICTTIETNRQYMDIMRNSPTPIDRANGMNRIGEYYRKFVTIEPIMDFDLSIMVELIKRCQPEQVNIGADSGGNNLPEPNKDKILLLIDELNKFTKIENKKNLARLLK